jgi:hypothetical protein
MGKSSLFESVLSRSVSLLELIEGSALLGAGMRLDLERKRQTLRSGSGAMPKRLCEMERHWIDYHHDRTNRASEDGA